MPSNLIGNLAPQAGHRAYEMPFLVDKQPHDFAFGKLEDDTRQTLPQSHRHSQTIFPPARLACGLTATNLPCLFPAKSVRRFLCPHDFVAPESRLIAGTKQVFPHEHLHSHTMEPKYRLSVGAIAVNSPKNCPVKSFRFPTAFHPFQQIPYTFLRFCGFSSSPEKISAKILLALSTGRLSGFKSWA